MKRSYILLSLLLWVTAAIAQPSNDNCIGALSVLTNGTCVSGTTVGADDSWQGSVGCQGGGNHPDVWYSFNSTGSQAQFTITTSGSWTGNVELMLVEGTCAGGFNLVGFQCGGSTLNATFSGLQIGTSYYFTISNSNSGSEGPFNVCLTTSSPPPLAGQDCSTAAILCNNNTFSQGTSSAGYGTQELNTTATCLGTQERQSKWFKFSIGCSGTLGFTINPNVNTDDYDFALFDVTSGCPTPTTPAIACNYWGTTPPPASNANDFEGCTGISIYGSGGPGAQPGIQAVSCAKDWANPGFQPYTFFNQSAGVYNPLNVIAGNTYALLVDNYSLSNSGFTLSFEGTAVIGPDADFTYTQGSCGTYNFTKACPTSNSTFLWQFGDGQQSTSQNPSHTYSTFGNFVISLQVKDALGCVTTSSQTINIVSAPLPTVSSPVTYCVGATASPLTATGSAGSTLLWYTVPTGGVGSATAPTPSTAAPGTTSYYVSQTIGGCESGRAQIDVIVNSGLTVSVNFAT
ncbi:MAG: PKD domain-containing protein, partial [Chitinophagaceae bacterium]